MLAGRMDVLQVIVLLLVELAEQPLEQHLGEADDRVERRAELVRHVGKELRLVPVRGLELPALVLDLAEQPHVLDGDHRLVGERPQERDVLVGEWPGVVAPDEDRADALALPEHRCRDGGLDAHHLPAFPGKGRDVRVTVDVRVVHDGTAEDRRAGRARRVQRKRKDRLDAALAGPWCAPRWMSPSSPTRLICTSLPSNRRSQLARIRSNTGRRVGDRARDRGQDLARRALLVERLLRLVEQAHVLDRDHRLVGERAEQRYLVLGKRPHVLPAQQDGAERLAFAKERRDHHGAIAESLGDLVAQRELLARGQQVGYLDRLAFEHGTAGKRPAS